MALAQTPQVAPSDAPAARIPGFAGRNQTGRREWKNIPQCLTEIIGMLLENTIIYNVIGKKFAKNSR